MNQFELRYLRLFVQTQLNVLRVNCLIHNLRDNQMRPYYHPLLDVSNSSQGTCARHMI